MRRVVFVFLGTALAGCGTAPEKTSFQNSAVIDAPFDTVWARTVEFMAANSVQVKTIEKDSGIIYAEQAQFSDGLADCGTEPLATVTGRPATLNVFLKPDGEKTAVTVNATFRVNMSFDGVPFSRDCYSTGTVERAILSAISR